MKVQASALLTFSLACVFLCAATWLRTSSASPPSLQDRQYEEGLTPSSALSQLVSRRGSLPSPIRCQDTGGCTLVNYQGTWTDRAPCRAAAAVYPRTEAELVSVVAQAVKEGRKMKVVTEIGHSISKLACPEGESGLLISTRDYRTEAVYVNKTEMSARADAGMQLRELVQALALQNVTIPHTPLWDGVSVGGVIATGSHGSGFFSRGSVVSSYVTAVRMVVPASPEDGYAKVITLTSSDAALDAARMSLGVLGVISKVTFAVLPMFKRSLSIRVAPDDDLEAQVAPFSRAHDFASLFWVPSAAKVLCKEENAVPLQTDGDGANTFPLVQPMLASQIRAMRAHQDAVERTGNVAGLCVAGEKMVEHRLRTGDGYTNSAGVFESFPVIGFNHRMQTTGGCQVYKQFATSSSANVAGSDPSKGDDVGKASDDSDLKVRDEGKASTDWWTCKWDPRLDGVFYHHTAIAIPLSSVASFIKDLKSLRSENPQGMCVLNMFGGIHIRFVPRSDAYLGDRVDSAVFELVYYRARDMAQGRLFQDVIEEIEQMMVVKYQGRPHWGKNKNVAFQGAWKKVVSVDNFLRVKGELDPDNLFSSAWADELLGLHDTFSKADHDHCALDGLCVCREDRHCSPSTGYTCQEGRIYKEARVCRLMAAASA